MKVRKAGVPVGVTFGSLAPGDVFRLKPGGQLRMKVAPVHVATMVGSAVLHTPAECNSVNLEQGIVSTDVIPATTPVIPVPGEFVEG